MAFTSTRLGLRSSFLAASLLTILVPALFSAENLATDPYIDRLDSKPNFLLMVYSAGRATPSEKG